MEDSMLETIKTPVGWANVKFQEVVDSFKRGPFGSAIKKEYFVTEGYKVYEQKNAIYDDPFRGNYFIDEDKYNELEAFQIKPKDYLVSCSGTIGKIMRIPDNAAPGVINQALLRIRISEEAISPIYFIYLFKSEHFKKKILVETRGSAMLNIAGVKELKEINFLLPPISEQTKIVDKLDELFSDLDNGIENLKKAQAQLKTFRQAVLKYAFEGKLTEEWRKQNKPEQAEKLLEQIKQEREKQFQKQLDDWATAVKKWEKEGKTGKKPAKPKKPKELPPLTEEEVSALSEIPRFWLYTYLAYLGELGRGKSKHRPRNAPELFSGDYPFIQTGEVKAAKGLIRTFSQTYSEFGLQQSKLWPTGTLCITIAANIADTAFLGIKACFPDSVVGFTEYEKIVTAKYIDYFIQSTKSRIEAYAPATAQKNINLTTLENLIIPYCPKGEQLQIVSEIESRLSVCDKLEQSIEESLQKSEALRQSILKKAFEGKLVPQDPNGEPAEKLLERIKAEKEKLEAENKSKRRKKK